MNKLKEIYDYREMIISLVRKDLRGRYKGSVLGFLWTFVNPLLQLIVYTIVFSNIMRMGIEMYHIFLFVALIPWIFFSSCLTSGSSCVINQKEMIKKIYFPREVLPISFVMTNFVNMLLCFVVIFIVLFFSKIQINFLAMLYLPIVMIVEITLCFGITMLSSAITVYFRDLEHILGIFGMAWMYLTPVIYNIDIVPRNIMPIFYANPMTPIIIAYRDILYYSQVPKLSTLIHAFILGVIVLIIGIIVFQKLQKHFAEEL